MPQGLRLPRLWLGLVLVAFCLPLFVGLGRADLETDEAIYSFAVDRILEIGDWLAPRSSPVEDAVFLEKPPLKFWLVAAPIKLGVLPHSEFGLRFLDATFGSLAFVYVFAIGMLLAGPTCGGVAVLLLFIHIPLLHMHGLRTNNMEASQLLAYCGGVFHFLRWAATDDSRSRRRHVYAVALWFVLGFLTKFVAALFLPVVLGLSALLWRRTRVRLFEDRVTWLAAAGLVLVLCVPWFVYAWVRFGDELWRTMFGVHVMQRLTGSLDPSHLQPWSYYLDTMLQEFRRDQVLPLTLVGLAALIVQSVRRRWLEGTVVLLWAALPLAIISSGTSKVYHYAYPFLPPVALAAGYVCGLVVLLAPAPVRRLLEWVEDRFMASWPSLAAVGARPPARRIGTMLVWLAATLAIGAVLLGYVRVGYDGRTLFRSSGVWRPILVILVAAVLTRTSARVHHLAVALAVLGVMPGPAYRGQIERLWTAGRHEMRDTANCVREVRERTGTAEGVFSSVPTGIWHPLYYYFRRVGPWTYAATPLDPAIERYIRDPSAARPVLLAEPVWNEWVAAHGRGPGNVAPPMVGFLDTVLILPGPYGACSPESRLRALP